MVDYYKNEIIIVGYDLLNEFKIKNIVDLVNFYKKLVLEIRIVDLNYLLIMEGNNLVYDFIGFLEIIINN